MNMWQFLGDHPVAGFFLALVAMHVLWYPFRIVNRFIRHLNIRKAGWPPPHVDADGDYHGKDESC